MASAVYEACLKQVEFYYARAEDWVENNPTTIKAIATAGIIFGGVFLVAASTSFFGAGTVLAFIIVGGTLSLVSSIVDVYAEHHFQRMIQGTILCPLQS